VHRKHQDGKLGILKVEAPDQFNAIGSPQRKVDDYDIRFQLGSLPQRLWNILGLAANGKVRLLIDKLREALPHQGMIVNDQNTSFRGSEVVSIQPFRVFTIHACVEILGARFPELMGIEQVTLVPSVEDDWMLRLAPIASARWRMICNPIPWAASSSRENPAPLS